MRRIFVWALAAMFLSFGTFVSVVSAKPTSKPTPPTYNFASTPHIIRVDLRIPSGSGTATGELDVPEGMRFVILSASGIATVQEGVLVQYVALRQNGGTGDLIFPPFVNSVFFPGIGDCYNFNFNTNYFIDGSGEVTFLLEGGAALGPAVLDMILIGYLTPIPEAF